MSTARRPFAPLLRGLLALVAALLLVEGAAQVAYRLAYDEWLPARDWWGERMFTGHPYLVAVPVAGARLTYGGVTVAHNSLGMRGPEVTRERPPGVVRVIALGGSTTYCTGVSNDDTWPRQLERELGPGYQVLNLGVPGYSTVENLIQTALQLSPLEPAVAIYLTGWNDARSMHLAALEADYSGFHGRYQFHNLRLGEARPGRRLASVLFLQRGVFALTPGLYFRRWPLAPEPAAGALGPEPDERVLALYRRNLALAGALCRRQGIRPLLVPQALNTAALDGARPYGWLPFVRDRDLPAAIAATNRVMAEVAAADDLAWAGEVLVGRFERRDFIDQGHLTAAGNGKLAAALAPWVRRLTE